MIDSPSVDRASGNGTCPFHGHERSFNPLTEDFLSNPWPTLAEIREDQPVFYSPEIDFWVVTRYEDVRRCFLDNKSFSSSLTMSPIKPLSQRTIESFMKSGFRDGPSLVNEDPPTHKARRTRLARQFEPSKIAALEPFVRETVTRYLDGIVKLGEADLMRDFIFDIPLLVAFRILDLPTDNIKQVQKWGEDTVLFSWGRPTDEQQVSMADALGEYWAYAVEHIARKKQNLGDDIVSLAIRGQMEEGEDVWSDEYLARMLLNLTFAGHETTTNATGNAIMSLLERRDLWDDLVANPGKVPRAVDEALRFCPSIIAGRRTAVVDVEIGGVTIPEGANILMYVGAANRDPAIFEEPDMLDLDRGNAGRMLSFGVGPHLCLGQPVAKLEMRVILEELTRRLPHLELMQQEFSFTPINTNARGPDRLMVRWDPSKNPLPADRP